MSKKIINILLFLPVIVLAGVILRYDWLAHFEQVNVAVQGYDPKDFFSGYYMNLQIDWQNTDCTQFADNICPQEDFDSVYRFYIHKSQSRKLEKAVVGEKVELVFSYAPEFKPVIVDLRVNGQSYLEYVEQK